MTSPECGCERKAEVMTAGRSVDGAEEMCVTAASAKRKGTRRRRIRCCRPSSRMCSSVYVLNQLWVVQTSDFRVAGRRAPSFLSYALALSRTPAVAHTR